MWRMHDPSIQHAWHPKNCSALRGTERELMCIGAKVSNEGSRAQLGLLLLLSQKPGSVWGRRRRR